MMTDAIQPLVYQGQFGEFTITDRDRWEVVAYRATLAMAAICVAAGAGLVLLLGATPLVLTLVSGLYVVFCLALGLSLWLIHIYMQSLHRLLQLLWGIGALASVAIAILVPDPLALTVYQQPLTLLGVGFVFAALTGIFFKEAFCFNRLETKLLTFLVPILLLGHLTGWLSLPIQKVLLSGWAVLFLIFSLRKLFQPIPADIGDKSVFTYLKQEQMSVQAK